MPYQHTHFEQNGTSYTVVNKYVDVDTGEFIEKKIAQDKTQYIKIKRTKYETTYNATRTRAAITYITICRKQPQRTIFENLSR